LIVRKLGLLSNEWER